VVKTTATSATMSSRGKDIAANRKPIAPLRVGAVR
jgi:hypothetical protein